MCIHETKEVIANIENLYVQTCSECHRVFGVEGGLDEEEYTGYILKSYYRRAELKVKEYDEKIEQYLRKTLPEEKYDAWYNMRNRYHSFKVDEINGYKYLKMLYFSEDRRRRTLSLGRKEQFPEIELFLEWRLERYGYKRLRDYIKHTLVMIGDDEFDYNRYF